MRYRYDTCQSGRKEQGNVVVDAIDLAGGNLKGREFDEVRSKERWEGKRSSVIVWTDTGLLSTPETQS